MQSRRFLKKKKTNDGSLKKQLRGKPDFVIIICALFLSLFGLLMIFNVSFPSAMRDFGDKYYYFKEQLNWFAVGIAAMIFFSFFDYHKLYRLALPLLLATLVFLGAVFIPGIGVKALGASRWINLGFINFQPAEFAKLTLVIYLSAWFAYKEKGRLLSFLILLGLVVSLIVLEPDLGTAGIVSVVAVVLYFLSGASLWHFFFLLPIVAGGGILMAVIAPYRFQRILTFLNPNVDPQGSSYHLRQILLALGSGGWLGLGLGKSRQKFSYLPEAATDSIFAIVGEELGFLGATFLIFLFFMLFWRGVHMAFNAADKFGRLLAGGLISALTLQVLINLGAMVSLIPLTGVPLPFISYGGSNLIISFSMIGILVNISKQS